MSDEQLRLDIVKLVLAFHTAAAPDTKRIEADCVMLLDFVKGIKKVTPEPIHRNADR